MSEVTPCGEVWPPNSELLPDKPKGMRRCPTCRELGDDVDLLIDDNSVTRLAESDAQPEPNETSGSTAKLRAGDATRPTGQPLAAMRQVR